MKKKYLLFLFLFSLVLLPTNTLFAQQIQAQNQLNHFQVLFPTLISTGFIASYLTLSLFYELDYSESITYDTLNTMLFLTILPIYFHNLPIGLLFTGVSLGLYFASEYLWNINEYFIAQIPANGFMDFSFFSTYAIYREGRKKAKSGIYNDRWRENAFGNSEIMHLLDYNKETKWKPYTFLDLAIAPFKKDNLSDFILYIIIPEGFLAPFLQQLILGNNFEKSVFSTGKSYLGQYELPVYLGVPAAVILLYVFCSFVAIGEESLFRGFIYEELGATTNEWVAKISDMIIFPLFHVPSEIKYYQENPEYFFNFFIRRSLLTFIIDITYDRGGLSRSVAFHFWVDFTQLFAYYLINGGAPQQSFMDIVGLGFKRIEVQIVFSL